MTSKASFSNGEIESGMRFVFLRGHHRQTTLAIFSELIDETYDRMSKRALLQLIITKLDRRHVVVHDDQGWDAMLLMLLKPFRGYKVVMRLRGDIFQVITGNMSLFRRIPQALATRFILGQSDFILFNSRQLAARPKYRFAKGRSDVVHNPVMIEDAIEVSSINKGRRQTAPFRLLTVTNFQILEKINPLARALTEWVDLEFLDRHDVEWEIIGDGRFLGWFVTQVQAERFGDRVRIYGYRKHTREYYARAHILVYISGLDAFPNVALEGAYYHLPIVTNPESGGTLEAMVAGKTGMIVASAREFRDAIINYKAHSDMREAHGAAAHKYIVNNYAIEVQRARVERLLRGRFGDSSQSNTHRVQSPA